LKSSEAALGVARGSSYLIGRTIVVTAVSIGAFAIIARLISREEMGVVAVMLLVVAAAQLVTGLGVGAAATKFVASFDRMKEREKMRQAGYSCLAVTALATAVVVAVTYLWADPLSLFLFGSTSRAILLRLLSLEIIATSLYNPLSSILVGLKRFKEFSLVSVITFAVRQALVVGFLELGLGLPGLVVGYGIGDSLTALAMFAYIWRFIGPPTVGSGFKDLLKFSAPLYLGDFAWYAWTWFDRALLVPLVTLSQLGAYNVSITAFGVLNSMPGAISGTLFPYYSHLYPNVNAGSQTKDLENAITRASRYVSFLTIPLSIGMAVTALPAATLLAGSEYADSAFPLAVLSISLAAGCLVAALSSVFVVLGRTGTSAGVTIASVVVSLLFGFAAIPYLGIVGASLARGVSLIVTLGLSILLLRRLVRLRFDTSAYRSAWLASLPMAAVVLIVEGLLYSKYLLPLYVVVGGIVFFLAARLLHIVKQEDLQLFSDFLGPRLAPIVKWARILLDVRLLSDETLD
jgi:O-antigen/teichoic acid export membrane protein